MIHGIYFLLKGSQVVYVGQTKQIEIRLGPHRKDKDFDSHRFIPCCVDKLNEYESRWIRRFRPKYNKTDKAFYNRGAVKKEPGRHDIRIKLSVFEMAKNRMKERGMNFNQYVQTLILEECKREYNP